MPKDGGEKKDSAAPAGTFNLYIYNMLKNADQRIATTLFGAAGASTDKREAMASGAHTQFSYYSRNPQL